MVSPISSRSRPFATKSRFRFRVFEEARAMALCLSYVISHRCCYDFREQYMLVMVVGNCKQISSMYALHALHESRIERASTRGSLFQTGRISRGTAILLQHEEVRLARWRSDRAPSMTVHYFELVCTWRPNGEQLEDCIRIRQPDAVWSISNLAESDRAVNQDVSAEARSSPYKQYVRGSQWCFDFGF
jgi:hypothetical protein